MKELSFGQFLVDEGLITIRKLEIAREIQKKNRLLGDIALDLNYLTHEDISTILDYQDSHPGVRFGEAAVSLGYITFTQMKYLLDVRTRKKVPIGDILLQQHFIEEDTLNKAIMSFDSKRKVLKTIVIADPSSTTVRIIKSMLTRYGYTVFTAGSGKKAYELAQSKKADIVMISGILEDMEGFELSSRILSNRELSDVYMVMMSSDDSLFHLERAFENGVNHYLKKPVLEKELINIIYQVEREVHERRDEEILVVDDSAGARMVIFKELTSAGFKVHLATNGKEGVKKAKELKPDIITMDVDMPEMNGFEACNILKNYSETSDIPIIMISSQNSPEIREKGFDVGAVEFFMKPFTSGRMAEYVNMLLETRKISRSEKILVVDDSSAMRHIMKYIFTKNGFNVVLAEDGSQGLEAAKETHPDLIVTDCYMPNMDGFELAGEVRSIKEFRHVPIIMLTAIHGKDDVIKGLECGANDYLTKPFDEAEFIARVNVHLLNKKLFDQVTEERDRLEKMNHQNLELINEISLLNNLGENLQICSDLDEAYKVVLDSLKALFPLESGTLSIFDESRNVFESVAGWGKEEDNTRETLPATDCKAVINNSRYICKGRSGSGKCAQMPEEDNGSTYCIPLKEKDLLMGLIRLTFEPHTGEKDDSLRAKSKIHLMNTASKQISLALSNIWLREHLRDLSIRDPLTDLYNRRFMRESLEREIARAQRLSREVGIILMDVDHFKVFNDTYGHAAGDRVLKSLANYFNRNIRRSDIACRYGGEEFLIILPDIDHENLYQRAETCRDEIDRKIKFKVGGHERQVTISAGISYYPRHGNEVDQLIEAADAALYKAKQGGRNQAIVAD